MVDELSALGLRHVGYNVPVEFFGPFVNACIDTLDGKASAEVLAAWFFLKSVGTTRAPYYSHTTPIFGSLKIWE